MRDPLDLAGQILDDKYAIDAVVGEGGFAVVYKAMHLILKRPVAIKVFQAAAQFTDQEREKLLNGFVQEASLLADLSERTTAICQGRDVGQVTTKDGDVLPYMVLEWLEGHTLEAVLDETRSPRTLEEAMKWLEPIAEALALAHARGISHRDVKPANIFVLAEGRGLKLLDFGVAKVVQDAHLRTSSRTGRQSSFTPAYGAPEQFSTDHGSTGPWTDVYSLALVLVELVTGKPPLLGTTLVELGAASCDPLRRPTPRTLGVKIRDDAEEVIAKALAVSTKDRWRNVGDFWTALVRATSAPAPPLETSIPIPARPHRVGNPEGWDDVGGRPSRRPGQTRSMAPVDRGPTMLERGLYFGGLAITIAVAIVLAREAWGFYVWQKVHVWPPSTCTIENVRQDGAENVFTVSAKTGRGSLRADQAESAVETPLSAFGGSEPDPATFTRTRGAEVRCFYDPGEPSTILLRRYSSFAIWPLGLLLALFVGSVLGTRWMKARMDA
jgi:serine/threonine protein kinase